ncbi:MAG: glycosyltransferase [Candidatus Hydrogenedentes bacterium]|nr:glycosyltransferase [Candidatus Hydrogenedentota bacterium]
MTYAKLASATPRMLILHSEYWLDTACRNAADGMGWQVDSARVVAEGLMSRELVAGFIEKLVTFRPDFVLSVNFGGMDVDGLFARLFADLHLPYVAWFVDDPRTILMGRSRYATDYSVVLTWDKAYVPYLEGLGFPEVHVVPLAVDATVFNAPVPEAADSPPAFVGNSMASFAQREWDWIGQRPELAAAVRDAFDRGAATRTCFGRGLDALLQPALVTRLDPDEALHAELLFFVEGTRRLRHELAAALTPEGMELYGDPGWRLAFPRARGPVNYLAELPRFYARCQVSLNVTSIQMPNTVNQRVFDCPAAGGFLLTDAQPALGELFDVDTEVAAYRSLDEARDLLRHYRAHPAERRAVAERARMRVLNEHTYAHRLEHIVSILKTRFA